MPDMLWPLVSQVKVSVCLGMNMNVGVWKIITRTQREGEGKEMKRNLNRILVFSFLGCVRDSSSSRKHFMTVWQQTPTKGKAAIYIHKQHMKVSPRCLKFITLPPSPLLVLYLLHCLVSFCISNFIVSSFFVTHVWMFHSPVFPFSLSLSILAADVAVLFCTHHLWKSIVCSMFTSCVLCCVYVTKFMIIDDVLSCLNALCHLDRWHFFFVLSLPSYVNFHNAFPLFTFVQYFFYLTLPSLSPAILVFSL